ncbi:NB-ARC domain-containing protein [Saccharothrix texasensis]|uniref:NB-ARC domain-containing protein n=1 Tax=Saccharothrix texasensis TaxID=103734 RepID=A0A3N1HCK6_9PSEU|nr:NB-ARC domain-containing protein [Saccharothrix texasensis]
MWPVLVGTPPPLASAFQPREAVRERVLAARRQGEDVVLAQQDTERRDVVGTRVLAGGGGVGKSQLAAWFVDQAINAGTDLVVWVNASTPEQVITAYATAALRAAVPGVDGSNPATDATAFVTWLRTTDRTWLIVLDDVTDPTHLKDMWPPHRPGGWTLATTRLREASLTGSGRRRVDIDTFTPVESARYLHDRLTDDDCAHLLDESVPALGEALGHLPLALSHAAAFMLDQDETCAAYLARYIAGDERLDELMPAGVDPDAYGRPVAVALLLSLDAADTRAPVGLARPALALAAVLDPDGHPDTLWATPVVTDYLTAHRTRHTDDPVTPEQARQVLRTLHRYALIAHHPGDGHRAVRIHALTARAARETTPFHLVTHTAADALLQLWPDNDHITTSLLTALLANTSTLVTIVGDLLWRPDGHPLLYKAGTSLLRTHLHTSAITYWHDTTAQAYRILGADHPDTLTAQANLANSYWQAGRTNDAIVIEEKVVADSMRLLGPEHPSTLTAQANLASSYWQAGRTNDATDLLEKVVADSMRLFGPEHPDTLTAQGNLASSYWQAGRTNDATDLLEKVVADRLRLLGPEHPDTLTAQANLANSYSRAGRTNDATDLLEKVVADRLRLLGPEHPSTLTAQANLANFYWQAGRTNDATDLLEKVVADRLRLFGPEHPDTLTAQANLANSYSRAGRTNDATDLLEKVVADSMRLLGPEHPDTLTAQANLANSYRQAGRTNDATDLLEKVVADSMRLLGPEHPSTLTAQGNLANSYWQAGRTNDAIDLLEKVVADSMRLLGPEHPSTLTAQGNLASSYWQAGRTNDAIDLLEKVVADSMRLLGPEHPSTLTAQGNLASSYWQAGRTNDAIDLLEKVVADSMRLLGPEHPDTLTATEALINWQAKS